MGRLPSACALALSTFAATICGWSLAVSSFAQPPGQRTVVRGVYVDGGGVLRGIATERPKAQRARSKRATVSQDVSRPSSLRKVSLPRLQEQLLKYASSKETIPAEVRYLAGLYRVDYIFIYPEEKELVVAGPADTWTEMPDGSVVTVTSGEPVLELDDLITALRAFPPGSPPDTAVGCSIDPTPEGQQRLLVVLRSIGKNLHPSELPALAAQLREAMGPHQVVVFGLPADSSLAFKLVSADYAMKLIAMGVLNPGVRGLRSYVEMVPLTHVGTSLVQRWWFVPGESYVRRSDDGLTWEFSTGRVRLLGESEFEPWRTGYRKGLQAGDRWNQAFAATFTRKFPELSEKLIVFAELENAFDLLTLAALVEYAQLATKASWDRSPLLDPQIYQTASMGPFRQADAVVTIRVSGARATTPVGGVRFSFEQSGASSSPSKSVSEHPVLPTSALGIPSDPSQWWWD
jgi:hypothetical protein